MVLVTKAKSRTTLSHKKRVGAHHRQSKHYTKHYFPYLPLVLIVVLGLIINTIWAHSNTGVLGDSTDISATSLLTDTNTQRQADSESSLALNNQLTTAAQAKANDMVARDYWSHNTPDGKTPWAFMTAAGYHYQAAGENLAYGFSSSTAALSGWMGSSEHRANILNANFSQVGFGVAQASNYLGVGPETVIVAMYGEPAAGADKAASVNNPNQVTGVLGDAVPTLSTALPSSQRIPRIELLSGASWSMFVVSTLTVSAILWFMFRHAFAWRRVLVRSEQFVIHHRFLDMLIVSVATLGFVLTRTAGFIR